MNTFLTYSLFGLALLAVLHFIYEAILLPSFRLQLRFRLFEMRDRLRRLKEENPSIDDDAFHALDDAISWQMDNLHRLTFQLMHNVERLYAVDAAFRRHVAERQAIAARCELREFVSIKRDLNRSFFGTVTLNAGMWAIYIVPIAFGLFCIKKLQKKISHAVALTNRELETLSPA